MPLTPRPLPQHLRGPQRPLVVPPSGGFAASLGAEYGADPEGDARRRTEQGVTELPDGTTVAGLPDGEVGGLVRIAEVRGYDESTPTGANPRGLLPAVVEPEVVEGELLDDDPHAITRTEHPGLGVSWVCACGQWEALATGPSSAAWAGADHRRHVIAAGE